MIKKIIIGLILGTLTFNTLIVNISAESGNEFDYYIQDDGIYITKYTGTNQNIAIPEKINGIDVTTITNLSCPNILEIENLSIPKTIKDIDTINCTIPIKGITVAYDNPNYIVDNGVLYTSDHYRLIKCTYSISSLNINPLTRTINNNCFENTAIQELVIPNTVTNIDYLALSKINNLKSLSVLANYSSLNIIDCPLLEKIYIAKTITRIEDDCFSGCNSLKEIVIDSDNSKYQSVNNVIYNDQELYYYPSGKTDQTFIVAQNIKSTNQEAFADNKYLKEIVLPDTFEKFGLGTFNNCSNLETINIPTAVNSLHESYANQYGYQTPYGYIFEGCYNLTNVEVDKENKSYLVEDGTLYSKDYSILIKNLDHTKQSIVTKDATKVIDQEAFSNCKNLVSIDLNNVSNIMKYAFINCTSLQDLTYPMVEEFGTKGGIFTNCTSLKKIKLPDKLTSIYTAGEPIFKGCTALTDLDLNNLEKFGIGDNGMLFFIEDCPNLKKVIIPKKVEKLYLGNDDIITYYVYENSYAHQEMKTNYYNDKFTYKIIKEQKDLLTNVIVDSGTCDNLNQSVLRVEQITNGSLYKQIEQRFNNFNLYNLSWFKDNQSITIDGICNVKIPIIDVIDPSQCKVYYINDNGEYINMHATYRDGYMEFKTNHFSNYIITDSEPVIQLGDINDDGFVNYSDAVLLLQADTGIISLTDKQKFVADFNNDLIIDYNDAVQILKYDAGIIKE